MRITFVVFGLLLVYIVVKIPAQPGPAPAPAFELAITALGLFEIVAGLFAPLVLRRLANRAPQTAPKAPPAKQWLSANIVTLACFDACMLFGLVLHFVGASPHLVVLLIGAGLAALILWRPGAPPTDNDGSAIVSL
jgi:hypothetical protein